MLRRDHIGMCEGRRKSERRCVGPRVHHGHSAPAAPSNKKSENLGWSMAQWMETPKTHWRAALEFEVQMKVNLTADGELYRYFSRAANVKFAAPRADSDFAGPGERTAYRRRINFLVAATTTMVKMVQWKP